MRATAFQTAELQAQNLRIDHNISSREGPEDPDVYVGDAVVLERMNKIIQNIKNGVYNEETKQELYHYAEYYLDTEKQSAYIQQTNEAVKYFVTGWWLHSLINNEEKLTHEKSLEDKQ